MRGLIRSVTLCCVLTSCLIEARADPVPVRYPQGCAHGFVEVTTTDGTRIAVGDLLQRAHGGVVSSELVLRFFDGSLDDETTVFSQHGIFRFISDHHIQRGPSFPKPVDVTIDARKGRITSVGPNGETQTLPFEMPTDTYNGLASTLLMNVSPSTPETRIAIVVPGDKPRLIHLSMKNAGTAAFTLGGTARKATDYLVHVELGGVAGVVAPIVGKDPPDYHVLILSGSDPAFIRVEGPLYEGGPLWRIQQISPVVPP